MRRFENVDIISALRKIVNNNNLHYKNDFEYDADMLKAATVGDRFLWLSRYSGTWLISERDAHIRNTEAYSTWQYYTDTKNYGVKAFAIEITGIDRKKPVGNIYELDYTKHREAVRGSSFNAVSVDVKFKPAHWERKAASTLRTFDIVEYDDRWQSIISRFGQAESIRHNLSNEDDAILAKLLDNFKIDYENDTKPGNVNDYVRDIVRERFHEYGYTRDDMVFTTPEDAHMAIKHHIPVYILHPNNVAEETDNKEDINNATYSGKIFGMGARDKQLLNFFVAGNTIANLPFTSDELKSILFLALDKGKENIADVKDRANIDGIIRVLDTALFAIDSHNELIYEQCHELDDGLEQ